MPLQATVTYTIGLGANNSGYNISSIRSIAAWNGAGFGNQAWTLAVQPAGGGSFVNVATVDYQPLGGGDIGATKVTRSNLNITGIQVLRVTTISVNGGANGGAFVWRELDAVGTPTPSVADTAPPLVSTLSPADGSGNVAVGSNLVVTFNEPVVTGTGHITIKNLDTPAQSLVITLPNAQVAVSGAVLTINPNADLTASTRYAIQIDATAIADSSGNYFVGINNDTNWDFTTAATPLRIMCLGDSITAGYTDNPTWSVSFMFGYRSGLYTRLTNAGYNFLFVGGSAEPWNNAFGDPSRSGTYKPTLDLRDLGQGGHRGYGGASASTLQSNTGRPHHHQPVAFLQRNQPPEQRRL